jgi:hypothetical protein
MAIVKFPKGKMTERLSAARYNSVDIPELIGLCRGVLADGTINLVEATFILQWLTERPAVLDTWPANELHNLLCLTLEDGLLEKNEAEELSALLEEVIGDPVTLLIY